MTFCDSCKQPLNMSGQCTNEDCKHCAKCAKHSLPIRSGGKCKTCLSEALAERNLQLQVGNVACWSKLLAAPIHWLNSNNTFLETPGDRGVAAQPENISIKGKTYPWTKLAGEARLMDLEFVVDHGRATFRKSISGEGKKERCFYLPWNEDNLYSMTLDSSASVFVTATLNGCYVMIGGTRQSPTVFHINLNNQLSEVTQGTVQDAWKIQNPQRIAACAASREVLGNRRALTDTVQVFGPQQYMKLGTDGYGRVWGFRDKNNEWNFYYQMNVFKELPKAWKWPVLGVQWGHHGDWISYFRQVETKKVPVAGSLWPLSEGLD